MQYPLEISSNMVPYFARLFVSNSMEKEPFEARRKIAKNNY